MRLMVDAEGELVDTDQATEGFTLHTPEVFAGDLLDPHRYKGIHGGRGGGKSHDRGEALIEKAALWPSEHNGEGLRWVCIREVQKTLDQSVKRLLEDKIQRLGLGHLFEIRANCIIPPGDSGIILFQGMQNHTAESIKSLEGFHGCWFEEAQTASQRSLDLLRPTIRTPESELWFTWNPSQPTDPVDAFFRGNDREDKDTVPYTPPPDSVCVEANYLDNPFFPEVLETDRAWDQNRDPDKYSHVWGGGYIKRTGATVFKNWKVEDFVTPHGVKNFMLGGDFGYSVDPSVLIRMWQRDSRTLMIDFEAYRVGCEVDDTPALYDEVGCSLCAYKLPCPGAQHYRDLRDGTISCSLCDKGRLCPTFRANGHAWARDWTITADSARPETISYLRRHGYPKIKGSKKGANSVYEGVVFLKNYNLIVHPRCKHTADELTFYSWKIDPRTEQVTNVLSEKKNHVIDSKRYAVEDMRRPKAKVFQRSSPSVSGAPAMTREIVRRSARVF